MDAEDTTTNSSIDNTSKLISGSVILTTSMLIMASIQFLILLVISNKLGSNGIGFVSLTTKTVGLVSILVTLGIPSVVTQKVAALKESGLGASVFTTSLVVIFPFIFISTFLLVYFAPTIGIYLGFSEISILIAVQSTTLPFVIIGSLVSCFLRGQVEFKKVGFLFIIHPVIQFGLIIFFLESLTPITVIYVNLVSAIMCTIISISVMSPRKLVRPSSKLYKPLLIGGAPLLVVGFSGMFIDSIDIIILGFFFSDLSIVGAYSNAFALSSYFRFLIEPISFSILPLASSAIAASRYREAETIFKTSNRMIVVLFIPVTILASIMSREILVVLFPFEFSIAADALSVLFLSIPFLSLYSVANRMLISAGKSYLIGIALALSAGIDLILTIILVQLFGMIGAAVSTALTFMLMCCLTIGMVKRNLKFSLGISFRDIVKIAIFYIFSWIGYNLMGVFLPQMNLLSPIALIVLVSFIALFIQVLLKPISPNELQILDDLMEKKIESKRIHIIIIKTLKYFSSNSSSD